MNKIDKLSEYLGSVAILSIGALLSAVCIGVLIKILIVIVGSIL